MVTLKTVGRIAVGVVTIGSAIAIVAPEVFEGILGPPFERLGPHVERAYDWWARVWLPKEITVVDGEGQAAIDCSRCDSFMLSDEDVCGNCGWDRRS